MKGLYEKTAVAPLVAGLGLRAGAGIAARALGTGLWHGARALAGSPASGALTGAARVGSNIGTGLNATNSAISMGSMVKDLIPKSPTPPQPNSANVQASSLSPKMGSFTPLERRFAKLAFGVSNAANIASYLSLIGAEIVPHDNPWHMRLEAAGLGGLAASTAGSMIANPEERDPGVQELAGLALFGNALRARSAKHAEEKRAFVGPALDISMAGIPSALGYLYAKSDPDHMNEREARAILGRRLGSLGSLWVPGSFGYHYGQRAAAQRIVDRAEHGEPPPAPTFPGRTPYAHAPYASP